MEKLLQLIWPLLAGFAVCIFVGPFVIRMMKRLKFGQQVRDDGPQSHLSKQNTPTIGGLIIFIGLAVSRCCSACQIFLGRLLGGGGLRDRRVFR